MNRETRVEHAAGRPLGLRLASTAPSAMWPRPIAGPTRSSGGATSACAWVWRPPAPPRASRRNSARTRTRCGRPRRGRARSCASDRGRSRSTTGLACAMRRGAELWLFWHCVLVPDHGSRMSRHANVRAVNAAAGHPKVSRVDIAFIRPSESWRQRRKASRAPHDGRRRAAARWAPPSRAAW